MSSSHLYIPGYICYSNFDPDPDSNQLTKLRSICIYFSNNLRSSDTSDFEEHLWIHIKFNSSHSIRVGCIYRSPSSNLENSTNSLCQLHRQVISSSSSYLTCDDFKYSNIDMCVTSSSPHSQLLIDTVQDLFMCQHVMEPTRFRGNDTLDLVFTNNDNMIENLKYLPGLGSSDHLCISLDVELPVCQISDLESVSSTMCIVPIIPK